jgi:hypothetical protein
MKKHRTIWTVLALIVVVGAVGWFIMPKKEEAKYQGKTVREWFESIPHPDSTPLPTASAVMVIAGGVSYDHPRETAMLALKKEAIPFLLHQMKTIHSKSHNAIFSALNRLSDGRVMSDSERQYRILYCFIELGSDANEAIPELNKIVSSGGSTNLAMAVLNYINSDAVVEKVLREQ